MKVSNLMAAAGAILILNAGAASAAEDAECCKDRAPAAPMDCCDEMETEAPSPAPAPTPAPAPQRDDLQAGQTPA